jgi:hypothetical protein
LPKPFAGACREVDPKFISDNVGIPELDHLKSLNVGDEIPLDGLIVRQLIDAVMPIG